MIPLGLTISLVLPIAVTGIYGIWVSERLRWVEWSAQQELVLLAAIGCFFWPIGLPYLISVHLRLRKGTAK